jgi:hypothetical protein
VAIVAILFSAVLIGLLVGESMGEVGLPFFFALCCYATLELLIKRKQYYNAGVDNVLMLACITGIVTAFFINDINTSFILVTGILALVFLGFCLRFTDAFMASLFYLSFFVFVFLLFLKLGDIAKATAPLFMMGISASAYFITGKLLKDERLLFFRFCCSCVKFLTLITFYTSANYFVVRELSFVMFNSSAFDDLPLGWLFWIFTIVIPIGYIAYGIRKKDFLFMRTGLALTALTVFTVRFYYGILPTEYAMLIAGIIIIAVSYALIKYLSTPKHGYSFAPVKRVPKSILDAEALIIAQTFGKKVAVQDSQFEFGGGSSGGGGATRDY